MLERTTRAPGDCAAVTLASRVRIAGELLQTQTSSSALFIAAFHIACNCLEFRVFFRELATRLTRFSSRWIKAILATGHLSF